MFLRAERLPDRLPKEYPSTLRCYFRISGGMGDVLICLGIVSNLNCIVDVSVPRHLIPLVKLVKGIRNVFPAQKAKLNQEYDVEANFDGIFATFEKLVNKDYYEVAADKIRGKIGKVSFNLNPSSFKSFDYVLHPSSSNSNRSWKTSKWYDLAKSLEEAGNTVAWLGTKKEPGFSEGNIFKLSEVSDDLVWQTEVLKNAKYFIGNDSGFAHLAGILNVPGNVLFFNTNPDNVIKHYPNLSPICGFNNKEECTGNLNPLDAKTVEFEQALTCEKVTEILGIPFIKSYKSTELPKLRIIGEDENKIQFFKSHLKSFNITDKSNVTLDLSRNKVICGSGSGTKEFDFIGGPYDLSRFLISKGIG